MELKDIPSEDSFQSSSEQNQSVSFCLLYVSSSLQFYVHKDPVSNVVSSYEWLQFNSFCSAIMKSLNWPKPESNCKKYGFITNANNEHKWA